MQANETHRSGENGVAVDMSYDDMRQRAREMYEQGDLSEAEYGEAMELVDQLEEESAGNEGGTTDNIQYSINTTESGLKYVKLDGNIFLREDGTEMSQSEAYNQLVGKEITLEDGDTITFVKNLPGRSVYNELFKKLPGYEPGIDVKAVSQSINRNIVETIMASSVQNRNEPQRHNHPGIVDFDQREVYLVDDNSAYRLELCIANLTDGKKIAYVKRYIEKANTEIEQEIKKAETAVQNRLNQPSKGIIRNISKTVNENFSISDQVSKQDVVSDLREILRRGGDPAELRRYVESMERGTERAAEAESTDSQDAEVQEILNAAREQNISVDEYLRRNWEQYEYDGQLNPAARAALDQEKGHVQYSVSDSNQKYDYTKSFAEQVDDYKAGLIPVGDTLLIGATPEVYQSIGFNALPMTINTTHVDYALNGTKDADHFMGEAVLKQLPESIKDPVAVFVSETHGTTSVIALLNFTVNGKQSVAPIVIDGFGKNNSVVIDSNAITSVYGKTTAVDQLYRAVMDNAAGKFALLYINKKEAVSLLQRAGHQLSGTLMPRDGFIHSIREKNSPVKPKFNDVTETQQFKRWFGDRQGRTPGGFSCRFVAIVSRACTTIILEIATGGKRPRNDIGFPS